MKFTDPKFMNFHEKDMKHSNYFIICLPSFFSSIIEVIIEQFVI